MVSRPLAGAMWVAGLLGSTVTLGYGTDGKHGANYIQTAAASVGPNAVQGAVAVQHEADRGCDVLMGWRNLARHDELKARIQTVRDAGLTAQAGILEH